MPTCRGAFSSNKSRKMVEQGVRDMTDNGFQNNSMWLWYYSRKTMWCFLRFWQWISLSFQIILIAHGGRPTSQIRWSWTSLFSHKGGLTTTGKGECNGKTRRLFHALFECHFRLQDSLYGLYCHNLDWITGLGLFLNQGSSPIVRLCGNRRTHLLSASTNIEREL